MFITVFTWAHQRPHPAQMNPFHSHCHIYLRQILIWACNAIRAYVCELTSSIQVSRLKFFIHFSCHCNFNVTLILSWQHCCTYSLCIGLKYRYGNRMLSFLWFPSVILRKFQDTRICVNVITDFFNVYSTIIYKSAYHSTLYLCSYLLSLFRTTRTRS